MKPPRRQEVKPFSPSQRSCLRRCAMLLLLGREQRATREFARTFGGSPRLFPTREARVKWAWATLNDKPSPEERAQLDNFLKEHPDVVPPSAPSV